MEGHQNRHHSNGALRTSVITGSEDGVGTLILDENTVQFGPYSSATTTKLSVVSFPDLPETPVEPIKKSAILRVYFI